MAIHEENQQRKFEAEQALLTAIKDQAKKTTAAARIQELAYAYALVVGAGPKHLPGGPTTVSTTK